MAAPYIMRGPRIIREGQAQLKGSETVFFNPVQEFNRDLSVLVLRTYLKHNVWHHKREEQHVTARGGLKILDALSASGLRSIRYAKELGDAKKWVRGIVANDLNERAVNLIKTNITLNNVEDLVTCSQSDARQLICSSSASYDTRFHVIDLDPFGSGAQFFDAAIQGIGEAGLLMVTCTDTAVLCGNASESCFARYGSMSMRGDFCHDAALRIILRSLAQHASVYGRYIKPLLSLSVDFYVRLFVQVFTSKAETKLSASKLSQVYLCKECKTFELQRLGKHMIEEKTNLTPKHKFKPADVTLGDKCQICQGGYSLCGPIWSNPIHDKGFLDLLKQELKLESTQSEFATFRRIQGMIYLCSEELDVPLFHSITHMSSVLRMKAPRTRDIMSALVNSGYKVSLSHTYHQGFKTDASNQAVWGMFCKFSSLEQERNNLISDLKPLSFYHSSKAIREDSSLLGCRIRATCAESNWNMAWNFEYNPAIETESQKLSMLRFQINPCEKWGPKSRPKLVETNVLNEDDKQSSAVDSTKSHLCRESADTDTASSDSSKRRKLVDPSRESR